MSPVNIIRMLLASVVIVVLIMLREDQGSQPAPARSAHDSLPGAPLVASGFSPLISFEPGRGGYLSRGHIYSLYLTPAEASFTLRDDAGDKTEIGGNRTGSSSLTMKMKLIGADPGASITGLEQLPGKVNYLTGNDPARWRTDIPTYAKVRCRDVYPGVDLIYHGNQRQLEYDFEVAPGAKPEIITLEFENVGKIELDGQGDLVLHTDSGQIRQHKPVIYQEADGIRRLINGNYLLKQKDRVSFEIGDYDAGRRLVIDPVFNFSTFLGGYVDETGDGIAVDTDGNVYVTGTTASSNFPRANPVQPEIGGLEDAVITKLSADGSAIIYSTFLGGGDKDESWGITVDASGSVYVTGLTYSTNFPTVSPIQPAHGSPGGRDAFVAKLNPNGSSLAYSTYLGGSGNFDRGNGIAADAAGNAYVCGETNSADFPVKSALQPDYNGGSRDGFISVINSAGSAFVYSTYLGGTAGDASYAIDLETSGSVYVTGSTSSPNYPVVAPFQAAFSGISDAFVTKLNAAGSNVVYSTYLGGAETDVGLGIAVDASGSAYVTGYSYSDNFPVVNPVQATRGGFADAFVAKLNTTGTALVYSTYLGGVNSDIGNGIAVTDAGSASIIGEAESPNFPTANAIQDRPGGSRDAFLTALTLSGTELVYSTYLGGDSTDRGLGIAVDASGSAYIIGHTYSLDFPVVPGAFQIDKSGSEFGLDFSDIFVTKISAGNLIVNTSAASYKKPMAADSIVAAFGGVLATGVETASTFPLPTELAGTTVRVRDKIGHEVPAPLFHVSPTQVNYYMPPEIVNGPVSVTITNGDGVVSLGLMRVTTVAPALFTANSNGFGIVAGLALRIKTDGSRTWEPIARFDEASQTFVSIPIDLGVEGEDVYLVVFGTGIRHRSSLRAVNAVIGDASGSEGIPVLYAGAQGEYVGLDQVNLHLPKTLTRRGVKNLILQVDAELANIVHVNTK